MSWLAGSSPASRQVAMTVGKRASRSSLRRRGERSRYMHTSPEWAISWKMARLTTSLGASSMPSGAYFRMNRSPSRFTRCAPSPRSASVSRVRGLPGTNRVVGWNCRYSQFTIRAWAR